MAARRGPVGRPRLRGHGDQRRVPDRLGGPADRYPPRRHFYPRGVSDAGPNHPAQEKPHGLAISATAVSARLRGRRRGTPQEELVLATTGPFAPGVRDIRTRT